MSVNEDVPMPDNEEGHTSVTDAIVRADAEGSSEYRQLPSSEPEVSQLSDVTAPEVSQLQIADAHAAASSNDSRKAKQIHGGVGKFRASKRVPGYGTVKPAQLCIGQRVRVLWKFEPLKEYDGEVIERREQLDDQERPTLAFYVRYDDGDRRWHSLEEGNIVKLLPGGNLPGGTPISEPGRVAQEEATPIEAEGYELRMSSTPSGYAGVYSSGGGRWTAQWKVGGKSTRFGTYDTRVEAAVAVAKCLSETAVEISSATDGAARLAPAPSAVRLRDDSAPREAEGYILKLSSNQSGYKGVCRSGSGWRALFKLHGEKRYLGIFGTPVAAAVAVAKARHEMEDEVEVEVVDEDGDEDEGEDEDEDDDDNDDEDEGEEARAGMNASQRRHANDRFVEMDGIRLHIYPRPARLRGRKLYLRPQAISGFLGVHWKPQSSQPYLAIVYETDDGGARCGKSLGSFDTAEEAALSSRDIMGLRPSALLIMMPMAFSFV